MQQAKSACKKNWLFKDYDDAIEAESKAVEQAKSFRKGMAIVNDLQGNKHKKEHGKSMESFQDCITFHLLDMFPIDAAEQQHFYISNVLMT